MLGSGCIQLSVRISKSLLVAGKASVVLLQALALFSCEQFGMRTPNRVDGREHEASKMRLGCLEDEVWS